MRVASGAGDVATGRDVVETTTWHGDPALRICSPALSAVVLPGRGGRIASLVDADGREWLEQPRLPLTPVHRLPADFVAGDMFGWDECAPTIDACVADGHAMPDHGDVWDQPWRDLEQGWLGVESPSGTYALRRRIEPVQGGLRLDYVATTRLARFPFLWAAHPQFAAPPGTTVELPGTVLALLDGEDPELTRHPLTPGLASIDAVRPGGSRKLFVEPDVLVTTAALLRADGSRLTLAWDPEILPYLGLWYDRGEFSRGDVIAIEPMTGFFDFCDRALTRGRVRWLTGRRPLTWSMTLTAT